MLEYMDRVAINAVEDVLQMGWTARPRRCWSPDRQPGRARARELAAIVAACARSGAVRRAGHHDPDEGEAFLAARRMAIPAVERLGPLLLEDVGVPLPRLPDLVAGIEAIAAARAVTIALIAPRRRRQHPPVDRLRPRRPPR